MFGSKKSLAMKGKYDIRALLSSGPLKRLTIDQIMDDINVTAAAIDSYTLIIQNCKSVNLFDCVNDTLNVPEVVIRECGEVRLPTVIRAVVTSFTNSKIVVPADRKLHIGGDCILTNAEFDSHDNVHINGTIYADSESYKQLSAWGIHYRKAVDIGNQNAIDAAKVA